MGDNTLISFPKLIDSSISTGIITFNEDIKNPKLRIANCSLSLNEINGKNSNINFSIDYPTLVNMNYQLKSMTNQIEEAINK